VRLYPVLADRGRVSWNGPSTIGIKLTFIAFFVGDNASNQSNTTKPTSPAMGWIVVEIG